MSDRKESVAGRPTHSLLGVAQAWLPILTAVIGALWGLWLFVGDQRDARAKANEQMERDSRSRLIEAQKPFLDRQLTLYFETAQVTGRLVQLDKASPQWTADLNRFWELYWTELSMVEHHVVESSMVDFKNQLVAYQKDATPASVGRLRDAALDLAHALRAGLESSWGDPRSTIVSKEK